MFRTNTSYDRWLQALTCWGDIATRSRDTLRQLLGAAGAAAHEEGWGGAAAAAATAPASARLCRCCCCVRLQCRKHERPPCPHARVAALCNHLAGPGELAGPKLLSAAATGRWLVAFSRALKAQLTEDSDLRAELRVGAAPAGGLHGCCGCVHGSLLPLAHLVPP